MPGGAAKCYTSYNSITIDNIILIIHDLYIYILIVHNVYIYIQLYIIQSILFHPYRSHARWSYEDCAVPLCEMNCSSTPLFQRGVCVEDFPVHQCHCFGRYSGYTCSECEAQGSESLDSSMITIYILYTHYLS